MISVTCNTADGQHSIPNITGRRRSIHHTSSQNENPPPAAPSFSGEDKNYTKRGNRGGATIKPFPLKLHEMLDVIEADGLASIVSWQPHGRCFVVHKPKDFAECIMQKYFNQSKFASFQRQLNLYGFKRLTQGKDRNGYYHEKFLRGRPHLSNDMVRMKIKGTKVRRATRPEDEPNFYAMPPVVPRMAPPPPQPQPQAAAAAPAPAAWTKQITAPPIRRLSLKHALKGTIFPKPRFPRGGASPNQMKHHCSMIDLEAIKSTSTQACPPKKSIVTPPITPCDTPEQSPEQSPRSAADMLLQALERAASMSIPPPPPFGREDHSYSSSEASSAPFPADLNPPVPMRCESNRAPREEAKGQYEASISWPSLEWPGDDGLRDDDDDGVGALRELGSDLLPVRAVDYLPSELGGEGGRGDDDVLFFEGKPFHYLEQIF